MSDLSFVVLMSAAFIAGYWVRMFSEKKREETPQFQEPDGYQAISRIMDTLTRKPKGR